MYSWAARLLSWRGRQFLLQRRAASPDSAAPAPPPCLDMFTLGGMTAW